MLLHRITVSVKPRLQSLITAILYPACAGIVLRGLQWFLIGVLCLCAACQQRTGGDQVATREAPEKAVEESDEFLLAPTIPGLGTVVLFYRDVWMHAEIWDMQGPPGVPFDAEFMKPYSLKLGIWEDGTIIWSQGNPREPEHFEGRVSREVIRQMADGIDATKFRTVGSLRISEEALYNRWIPAATIARLDAPKNFIVCSNLDQMELLQEYWYWDEDGEDEYPFTDFSFDQFCTKVPASYAQHLREYARLRAHVRSIIPKQGKSIGLDARIRWVLLPVPYGARRRED